ncbi:hypothetical protein Pse7367_3872 (plasmid) [Thalassoporum mexicanum PCC 7367]|uniref:plasmid replication protein, CyRepA1 family n=1 Tax=Thalassoporum mexicanum TaxID=3457544 RepID=UPI00029FBBF1|nr:plasmid replication protein, CyRepA1 family [Pseudanabaena sp. PCC 7367]AFY72095.1 hypothetical protein Pse7367_3872 [Pseudanabaena sp. PCC 7367]
MAIVYRKSQATQSFSASEIGNFFKGHNQADFPANPASELAKFQAKTAQEWIIDSAIAPELFFANVRVAADEEHLHGGEVIYPLHESLNWRVKRWRFSLGGKLQRPRQFGAIISTWNPIDRHTDVFQVKLSNPIFDSRKGKARKYENPAGRGQVGGFAQVTFQVWQTIAEQYQLPIACPINPANKSIYISNNYYASADAGSNAGQLGDDNGYGFWDWLIENPQISIVITEGMKKACALLSIGQAAIALSGITMGRVKHNQDTEGNENQKEQVALQPYLNAFAADSRPIYFCFDAETKLKTAQAVYTATIRTGNLFTEAGCNVRVVRLPLLPGTDKTGVDDFLVAQGAESQPAWQNLYGQALPLASYQWQWHNQQRLTHAPSLELDTPNLDYGLNPAAVPQTGIIALKSAKGTGKTKAIAKLVAPTQKIVLLGHRVSLMRNLCQRLKVHYKADLDKAAGQFISEDGYALRVGACVDSLLAFDPNQFVGCDLVIDEVEQVLKHLLCSKTCNSNGKRPALLANFHWLIQVARRVIVADADLSDASLDYLKSLRANELTRNEELFLISNRHQGQGYPVQFIAAKSESAIIKQILADINDGLKLFIPTDSKTSSKAIARLIEKIKAAHPNLNILLINSETSGGTDEANFIRDPNSYAQLYDVVIATPSLTTGVSIEIEHFDKVYGIFYGTAYDDADASQALARVRSNIPRLVWCANQGRNFSKVDRTDKPHLLKRYLLTRWSREVMLIRPSLEPALLLFIKTDPDQEGQNPHLDLWARLQARNNRAMWTLRRSLIERLSYEGNQVEIVADEPKQQLAAQLKQAKQALQWERYMAIAQARILTKTESKQLANKEFRTSAELLREAKTAIARFYVTNDVSAELVDYDDDGRKRSQILNLEALFQPELAIKLDTEAINHQAKYEKGVFIPDLRCYELGRFVREKLGLIELLQPEHIYTDRDLETLGDLCRNFAQDIKKYLGFTVPANATNIWIFRRLLSQLGLKTTSTRQRQNGGWLRHCQIEATAWQNLQHVLMRRQEWRNGNEAIADHPLLISFINRDLITPPLKPTATDLANHPAIETSTAKTTPEQEKAEPARKVKKTIAQAIQLVLALGVSFGKSLSEQGSEYLLGSQLEGADLRSVPARSPP